MGSNSSAMAEAGNPVLNYFLGFPVQPYWLIILQLLIIQLLQRSYSRFACWKGDKRTLYLPLELLILGEKAGDIFFLTVDDTLLSERTSSPCLTER